LLRGELTDLRAVERSDAGALHRWFNDPDLMHFWGVPAATVSITEVQRRIEEWLDDERVLHRPSALIIEGLNGGELGLVLLGRFDPLCRSSEVSLLIGERAEWGRGVGTDALTTVVDACFEQWGLHRLWLRVEAFNERAIRLYERCGFQREAVLRDASFHDGEFHDLYQFSLLATDPRGDGGEPG
jgi:RimJ/RimL family protein N-acetyltransferase